MAEAAEAWETVVNREAPVNCSTPNTSYESLLKWGENLEPTDAASSDAVVWNEVDEKMDGSEETVESLEEQIQSDVHTIVDSVIDFIVDVAVFIGGFDDPTGTPSDTSDTLHYSSFWGILSPEDAHVQPQEEAVVDEPQPQPVEVEDVVVVPLVGQPVEVRVEEVLAMVPVDQAAEVEVEDVQQLGNVGPPRRSARLRFKLNRNNL